MPTYEYKCDACDFRFERFQPITAKPIRKCPHCGKSKVKRLISAGGGMIFKGSGFYITDYRDSKYKESAKADSATGGESGGGKVEKGEKGEKGTAAAVKEGASEAKASTSAATKTAETAPASSATKSESKGGKPAKSEKSGK